MMEYCALLLLSCFLVAEMLCATLSVDQHRQKRQAADVDNFCTNEADGSIHAAPDDCHSYILCSRGYTYRSKCAAGLFYDATKQTCDFDRGQCKRGKNTIPALTTKEKNQVSTDDYHDHTTAALLNIYDTCAHRPDGTYAHPSQCDGYVLCSNGQAFEEKCPAYTVYRSSIGSCDFDLEGRCLGSGRNEYVQTPEPIADQTQSDRLMVMIPGAIEGAMSALTEQLQHEAFLSQSLTGSPRPFRLVQRFLRAKPLARQLSMPAFIINSASKDIIRQFGEGSSSFFSLVRGVNSPLPASSQRLPPDAALPAPEPGTCPWPLYNCKLVKFRSHDGSCNNLYQPLLGRAFTPFSRFIPPQYGDGVHSMRRARDGSDLPGARRVSALIAEGTSVPYHVNSLMLMQWGQFLDHDITLTAISKIVTHPSGYGETVDIECGHDGCDSKAHPACAPIQIPSDDPNFFGKKCLEFVRSQVVPNINCTLGPSQQLNQITAFIDASNVYGSSVEEAQSLRDLTAPSRGRLLQSQHPHNAKLKQLLPITNEDEECNELELGEVCFKAGDERVNEQSALTVMHTMWVREHNRIEGSLHEINPHWNGNTLYEETRRIVGAMMQHITFKEFLPIIIGGQEMEKYNLRLLDKGFFSGYRSDIDPSVRNAFATAAFRFGHTLVPKSFSRVARNWTADYPPLELNNMFFQPHHAYDSANGGVDGLARGMCSQNIESYDRFVVPQMTVHLFSQSPPHGLGTDLVSLNIQRARDHGIPGYNYWRSWCGLSRATDFHSLVDIHDTSVRDKLKSIYRHVDDIDLFPAGIAERSIEGGLVGPTFACIIGRQFQNTRQGDRFWYENTGAFGFNPDQLKELRKVTLAKMLCNSADNITQIQPHVMELPFREIYRSPHFNQYPQLRHDLSEEWFSKLWSSNYNARVDCSCIDDINLAKWKE